MADLSQLSDAQLQALLPPGSNTGPALQSSPRAFDLAHYSDAQLAAIQRDSDPTMSTGEDIARSAGSGLVRGGAQTATVSRGVNDGLHGVAQAATDFAARHLGLGNHIDLPQVDSLLHPPGAPGVGDVVQNLVRHGVQTANGALPSWAQINPGVAQGATDITNPATAISQRGMSPEQTAVALNGGIPLHVPQTAPGRYAQRATEFAPMLTAPGSASQRLANMLVPSAASQAAQDIAPDQYKGAAALAGALLGGGAVAMGSHMARAPHAALGGALGDVTDDQIMQAQQLRQSAAARGLNLSLPEAVQQVTNNGTGLGRLQRVIESTKQGQALTAPYFAERPGQVSGAVNQFADTIAPPTAQPSMIGVRAKDAAVTALDRARQTVNAIAGPDYAALPAQTMEAEPQAQLLAQPSYNIALQQLRSDPELGPTIAGLPDNSVAVVNAVKQRLGTMGEQAKGTPLTPGDNQLAGVRFGAKALADALAREASPQYASANDTVADLSQRYVDPLKAGPLGAMSQSAEVPAQTGALYPKSPIEGAPHETSAAVTILGRQAPGVAEDLTRQHIMNALNASMKGPRADMGRGFEGGQNQYAGAALAQALAGNPEQAATFRAGLAALPGGEQHAQGMADLLDALQATAKRQPPGSMTAFNESDLKDLHITPYANAVGRIADPLEWGKGIGDILNRANYRRNVSQLADMIMSQPEDTAATLTAAKAATKAGANPMLPAILAHRDTRH